VVLLPLVLVGVLVRSGPATGLAPTAGTGGDGGAGCALDDAAARVIAGGVTLALVGSLWPGQSSSTRRIASRSAAVTLSPWLARAPRGR
jgi:hypothetical protein